MTSPIPDVANAIEQLVTQIALPKGRKLVLAYSGGVDSEVLAHGLRLFSQAHSGFHYQLVHVHHGLSPNADKWVEHCLQSASVHQLPLAVERVVVKQGPRLSLEAEARNARYRAILHHLAPGDVLLTAHHEDDQLETILLSLKRGQGPKGLSAMGAVQIIDHNKFQLRPLLDCSRDRIEAYAEFHHLSHIEDESNQDDKYDRNFLRLEIIPRLKERWPSIATTASRSAALCAEQQALLDHEVSERLPLWLASTPFAAVTLTLAGFEQLSLAWQRQLFRALLVQQQLPIPSQVQLDEILAQLNYAKEDAKLELNVSGLCVRRFQGQAYVSLSEPSFVVPESCVVPEETFGALVFTGDSVLYPLPAAIQSVRFSLTETQPRLRLPLANEQVSIRFGLAGSVRCQPHFRNKGRELKKLWQELAVPPWERHRIPCIFYNEQLVAVVGLWFEKAFLAERYAPGITVSYS